MKKAYSYPAAAALGWILAELFTGGSSTAARIASVLFILFAAWFGVKVDQLIAELERKNRRL